MMNVHVVNPTAASVQTVFWSWSLLASSSTRSLCLSRAKIKPQATAALFTLSDTAPGATLPRK
jgi:hypothetical protein